MTSSVPPAEPGARFEPGSVRPLDSTELADLAHLVELAAPGHWSREALEREVSREGTEILIAWTGRLAVGFSIAHSVLDEAEVLLVGVHPQHRRMGFGKRLLLEVERRAASRGVTAIHLEVRASSAGAIALYRSVGYTEVGRRRAYYGQPAEDAVLMTRQLPRDL